ncbi:MAG: hypothetical protein ACYTXA_32265 [Nostoc sp.]
MVNENPQTEFDSPWKQILQLYFQDFMQFFFPQAHEEIDWRWGNELLDKELQQESEEFTIRNKSGVR